MISTAVRADGSADIVLDVAGLSVAFGAHRVLDGASMSVAAGTTAAVVGRSGSGKSTLLHCVLGLVRPQAGSVSVAGRPVAVGLSRRAARARSALVGVVFQAGHLLPELDPVENVALAGMLAGLPPGEASARARTLLDELGVAAASRSVLEYSGGEQQRIAVARAVINSPRLVIADEPTGSLDPQTRDTVTDLLFALPQRVGCAVVLVTHDPQVAACADVVYRIHDGQILRTDRVDVADGTGGDR